jgi:CheY-like chemotaxis protein
VSVGGTGFQPVKKHGQDGHATLALTQKSEPSPSMVRRPNFLPNNTLLYPIIFALTRTANHAILPTSPGEEWTLPNLPPSGQGCPMKRTMEGDTLDHKPSVLIVDRSEENREVLETALNRRGVQTFTAKHASEGVELGRRLCPDLVVLDLDIHNIISEQDEQPIWADLVENNIPIILLGNLRRNQQPIPGGEFVSKPYQYGPLIRRIEEILNK